MIVQKSIPPLMLSIFMMACHQSPKPETNPALTHTMDTVKQKYTLAMVDNKTDPACGMPLTAGIGDTVHYNGKVFGFCSDECKQAFLKDPLAMSRNAQLK